MRRTAAFAALAAFAAAAAPAPAHPPEECDCGVVDDRLLPRAYVDEWTMEPLDPRYAPYIDGALAQVRAKGEGRLAVICEPGDERAYALYRAPAAHRDALRAEGDTIKVQYAFDDGTTIPREFEWDVAGRYWRGPFGDDSRLANLMKSERSVTVSPLALEDVESVFPLANSWKSISAAFERCGLS
ncbi:MAG TPA: hypothetical protein VJ994_06835 [Paracoccaceae bacterium]|nr:hypothetical protein [Paracoccaceae bacterium]